MAEPVDVELKLGWRYDDALSWMVAARDRVIAGGRMVIAVGEHAEDVVTLGRHAPASDIVDDDGLSARGALVRRVERGGGATAHGPGQLVCYPVVSLARLALDVPALTSALELAAVDVLRGCFGIEAEAGHDETGVYVGQAKIASVGFRVQRRVITHGLSLNLDNDLGVFDLIATCGRRGRAMTSVSRLLRDDVKRIDRPTVAFALARHVASRCMLELPAWPHSVAEARTGGQGRRDDG